LGSSVRLESEMPHVAKKPTTKRRPAAQVAVSKKAAALKAENAAKRPQRPWLQNLARQLPRLGDEAEPVTPERSSAANLSQGPPHLLDKAQVCAIANVSFVTVWQWMRQGAFPRSRIVGGKSMWLSTEVDAWIATLPVRPLKGDAPLEVGA
jgi:predicted DNA-binding transcriptional regulator AlpA